MGVKFPKVKTYRSEAYLSFVRTFPCCVCGNTATDAHHTGTNRGMGIKANDLTAVPLCRKCHTELHSVGVNTFVDRHFVEMDLVEVNRDILAEFIQEKGL